MTEDQPHPVSPEAGIMLVDPMDRQRMDLLARHFAVGCVTLFPDRLKDEREARLLMYAIEKFRESVHNVHGIAGLCFAENINPLTFTPPPQCACGQTMARMAENAEYFKRGHGPERCE